MLPQAVFDQIVKTSGLRVEATRNERRGAVRVPMRGTAEARSLAHNVALPAMNVRLRDVSTTGVAVLLMAKQVLTKEFLVKLSLGEGRTVLLWCDTRRTSTHDGCTVVSAMFLKMMLPGQKLGDNLPVSSVKWHTFKPPVAPSSDAAAA